MTVNTTVRNEMQIIAVSPFVESYRRSADHRRRCELLHAYTLRLPHWSSKHCAQQRRTSCGKIGLPKRGLPALSAIVQRARHLLAYAKQSNDGTTASKVFRFVPEVDRLDHAIVSAQVDDARLAAGGNDVAHLEPLLTAVAEVDDDPEESDRRLLDCELDTAEVAADGRDDDRVVIHTVRDVFPSELVPALGRLGQGPGHEQLRHVLWRVAPSWLVQLPALVDEGELEALQRKVQGVPRQRMLLSAAITATQGYRAEEVVQNLRRARVLCQLLNDDTTLVSVLVGLGRVFHAQADRGAKEQVIGEEYRLLARLQEPALAIQLHTHLGMNSLWGGAPVQAQEHCDRVLALYNRQSHRDLGPAPGPDPAVVASGRSGFSLWLTGRPDQARSRVQQGLSWAKELGSAVTLSYALLAAAHVHWSAGLEPGSRSHAGAWRSQGQP